MCIELFRILEEYAPVIVPMEKRRRHAPNVACGEVGVALAASKKIVK